MSAHPCPDRRRMATDIMRGLKACLRRQAPHHLPLLHALGRSPGPVVQALGLALRRTQSRHGRDPAHARASTACVATINRHWRAERHVEAGHHIGALLIHVSAETPISLGDVLPHLCANDNHPDGPKPA